MNDDAAVVKHRMRRAFERAAATYDAAAVLQNEVCARMVGRLDYIKHAPARLLDAGAGTGNAVEPLRNMYPDAHMIALDIAHPMLLQSRRRLPWWRGVPGLRVPYTAVCGDLERLPLVNGAVGMVWSNLALQWVNDLAATFGELQRVLEPGGLLMFSTFGPDTLKELRAAYAEADDRTHVNRFVDMHDIGDMLVGAGFMDPVMDMEYITLTYETVPAVMRDLKAIGAHNVTRNAPGGLTGKAAHARVVAKYESFRKDGRLPATFEVVYGHAWKRPQRVGPSGRAVIDIKPLTRR